MLKELGFKKTASDATTVYKAVKALSAKASNARNFKDLKAIVKHTDKLDDSTKFTAAFDRLERSGVKGNKWWKYMDDNYERNIMGSLLETKKSKGLIRHAIKRDINA